jgi:AAA15 family ATPase/GTPase
MKKEKSKLTGVYLSNFQSINNPIFINLEHLTMFYGPNSAGKSSIIDALEIIDKIDGTI